MKISDTQALQERFMYLINNRVVLHNDQLDVDYIVLRVEVSEEVFSQDYKVRIVIDILDEIDKDIQRQLDTLKHSLMNFYQLNGEKSAGERKMYAKTIIDSIVIDYIDIESV